MTRLMNLNVKKFSQLGHIYGLNEDEINSIADSVINKADTLEEILGNISTRQTKLLLVYDLLAICYADGCYSLAEKNAMRSIVNMLHIEEAKLTALEEVIEESTVLNKKARNYSRKIRRRYYGTRKNFGYCRCRCCMRNNRWPGCSGNRCCGWRYYGFIRRCGYFSWTGGSWRWSIGRRRCRCSRRHHAYSGGSRWAWRPRCRHCDQCRRWCESKEAE